MCPNLHRHHARIHDPHVARSVQPQPAIDYTTEFLPHHRAGPDRVIHGEERALYPVLPIRVGPSIVIRIGHGVEAGLRFASGQRRQRRGFEQLADEPGAGHLYVEVDLDAKVIHVDLGFDERVGRRDLDCPTAERKEGPEVNADGIGVPGVVEEFNHRS